MRKPRNLSTAWALLCLMLGVVAVVPIAIKAGPTSLTRGIILAIPVYMAAHTLRVMRLFVLLGTERASLRAVAGAHMLTAAAGFLPGKTGEAVRVLALGQVQGTTWGALRTVWIERTFDAVMIVTLGLLLAPWSGLAWWLSVVFLLGTALVVIVAPGNLRLVKRWLIHRYTTGWVVRALPFLERATTELEHAQRHVEGRVTALLGLTSLIWLLELSTVALILGEWNTTRPLVSVLGTGFSTADSTPVEHYQLIISVVALALGVGVFLFRVVQRRSSQ